MPLSVDIIVELPIGNPSLKLMASSEPSIAARVIWLSCYFGENS
jgi:hypothetical protein